MKLLTQVKHLGKKCHWTGVPVSTEDQNIWKAAFCSRCLGLPAQLQSPVRNSLYTFSHQCLLGMVGTGKILPCEGIWLGVEGESSCTYKKAVFLKLCYCYITEGKKSTHLIVHAFLFLSNWTKSFSLSTPNIWFGLEIHCFWPKIQRF